MSIIRNNTQPNPFMSQEISAPTIQQQWDRFERWASRFRKSTVRLFDELSERDVIDSQDYLYLLNASELEGAEEAAHEKGSLAVLVERANEKINFLRGYMVDISFDGPEFMALNSRFLTLQYQSRCNSAFGFWFEQWVENPTPGGYHGFQGLDAVLFADSAKDIDFESVRNILPFDTVLVRQPNGAIWSNSQARELVQIIKDDLGLSRRKFFNLDGIGSSLITITFKQRFIQY